MFTRKANSHSYTHLIYNVHVLCYSRLGAAAMAAKSIELQNLVIHNERERDQRQVLVGPPKARSRRGFSGAFKCLRSRRAVETNCHLALLNTEHLNTLNGNSRSPIQKIPIYQENQKWSIL